MEVCEPTYSPRLGVTSSKSLKLWSSRALQHLTPPRCVIWVSRRLGKTDDVVGLNRSAGAVKHRQGPFLISQQQKRKTARGRQPTRPAALTGHCGVICGWVGITSALRELRFWRASDGFPSFLPNWRGDLFSGSPSCCSCRHTCFDEFPTWVPRNLESLGLKTRPFPTRFALPLSPSAFFLLPLILLPLRSLSPSPTTVLLAPQNRADSKFCSRKV